MSSFFFARAASEEAERVRLRTAANEMCEQWRGMADTIANARFLVQHPPRLVDAGQRNIVVGYANWLNRLGVRWRAGDLDVPYIRAESLDAIARGFWNDLETAETTLAASGDAHQVAAADALRQKRAGWSGFEWLASQPP